MIEFIMFLFGFYVFILLTFVLWESSVMIQDKKDRQRKGLTDYYDNTIEKDNA